jgi:hypothetical protein
MKKLVLLLLAIAFALTLLFVYSGCRKDIYVKAPDSLTGDYLGEMCYGVGTNPSVCQFITWRFTGDGYWMARDSSKYAVADPYVFCDNVKGKYELTDGVVFTQNTAGPTVTCDETRNPLGRFVIVTRNDSTLNLSQAQPGGVYWTINLTRQ